MNKKDLEFILYILLGTILGLTGLVAALFMSYIANYGKYWRIFFGFLIGSILAVLIGLNLSLTELLIYYAIVDVLIFIIGYKIYKDRLKNE